MLPGYKKGFLNRQAMKALNKMVQIPDANLGIGDAEEHRAIGLVQQVLNPRQKVIVGRVETTPIEKMTPDGHGPIFKPEDFPQTGFYGDSIGGF